MPFKPGEASGDSMLFHAESIWTGILENQTHGDASVLQKNPAFNGMRAVALDP